MHSDDIRAQLIKQFPAEVVETRASISEMCYSCPTCNRIVSKGMDQCGGCGQILSWKNVNSYESADGMRKAVLHFEVPSDFTPGNCRKCPISYIESGASRGVYECPLRMRGACELIIE